jgi:2-succinyl-6-hydroxy-2,4-cyclohexadiene-1-carboxylate synthase
MVYEYDQNDIWQLLGTENDRNLAMLHGFTGSSHNWNYLVEYFSKTYCVIMPTIQGHAGKPSRTDIHHYKMDVEAQRLVAGIESFNQRFDLADTSDLLGYSMGGRLALYIAIHYPDRVQSLILESASPGLKTETERDARLKADNELADKIEANGIEWFVDYWENLPLWYTQTSEQKAKLREQRLKNDPLGLANSLRGMGTGAMPSLWDELKNLKMPVKLIAGELDSKYVEINREMADLIPNADLSIVKDAGHTVHLEKPEEYTKLVLQFLDKHS